MTAKWFGHNQTGQGFYGREHGRDTVCKHANNPYGHNPECACGWKARVLASQIVPYDEPDYPESPYGAL